MISSMVLSFKRDRAGGAGPAVEAPILGLFVLLVPAGAAVVEPWGFAMVDGLETLPIVPNASGAAVDGATEDGPDALVVSEGLLCGGSRLGKKLVFGPALEVADASLLLAALLAPSVPNRFELCAAVGDFTVLLEAAVDSEDFAKLKDGVDGWFDVLEKSEGALDEPVGWLFDVDVLPIFENKLGVGLVSAGLAAAASGGWLVLSKSLDEDSDCDA